MTPTKGHAPPGQRFSVVFDQTQTGGHPFGVYRGYKVIPSHHSYQVQRGQTWEVEEILRWEHGGTKSIEYLKNSESRVGWGPVIYVWPLRRVT